MKKKIKKDDRQVMSCRLGKEQQDFILSFDRLAKVIGRKPSLVRALEQITVELGFKASGYDEEEHTGKESKKKEQQG